MRPMHADDPRLEGHIFGPQRHQLALAHAGVERHRVRPAPAQRHRLAPEQRERLRRQKERLRPPHAPVGPLDALGGVIGPGSQVGSLRAARVAEHAAHEGPDVPRALPRELAPAHLLVERHHQRLELGAGDERDGARANDRQHVLAESQAVVFGRAKAAPVFAVGKPAVEPLAERLTGRPLRCRHERLVDENPALHSVDDVRRSPPGLPFGAHPIVERNPSPAPVGQPHPDAPAVAA
ncbi:MAG TPA: hypothetical protein VFS43_13245 [Polyangiaceae bacterium]|nr:hypothetical protein [Polyangiaceae bacterium]